MSDSLNIGPVPSDEKCQQVGTPSYNHAKSRQECNAFIAQLKRVFGEPPEGTYFKVTSNPHDAGTYHDVDVMFTPSIEASIDYAFKVERAVPQHWDAEAKKALGL